MENEVKAWSWEKPTGPGLYLLCNGDVEADNNIRPFRIVEGMGGGETYCGFECYTPKEVAVWPSDYKFARLVVGG